MMRVRAEPDSSPWSYLARGVIALLFGAYMLLAPGVGLLAFIFAYGLFSLLDGIVAILASFFGVRDRRLDSGLLLAGLVSAGIGLVFLFYPILSVRVLSLLIAGWLVLVGIGTLWSAIQYRKRIRGEWLLMLAGAVSILGGLYLAVRPILAASLLPFLLGGYAVLWGVLLLAAGLHLWRHPEVPAPA